MVTPRIPERWQPGAQETPFVDQHLANLMQLKDPTLVEAFAGAVAQLPSEMRERLAATLRRSLEFAPQALATNLLGVLGTPHGVDRVPAEKLWEHVTVTQPLDAQVAQELAQERGHHPVILSTYKLQRDKLSPEASRFLSGATVVEYNHPTTLNVGQMTALVQQTSERGVSPDLVLCFMEPLGTEANKTQFYDALPSSVIGVHTAATGTDNKYFDVAAARGLRNSNAPGALYDDVGENALVLSLMGAMNIPAAEAIAATGSMEGCSMYQGRHEMTRGSTFGIIGLGQTGGATATRLASSIFTAEGSGRIIYTDPQPSAAREWSVNEQIVTRVRTHLAERLLAKWRSEGRPESQVSGEELQAAVSEYTIRPRASPDERPANEKTILYDPITRVGGGDIDRLLAESDVVIVQPPLIKKSPAEGGTQHLIDERALLVMKERGERTGRKVVLVNTARGPVVDEEAVAKALSEGWIAGYVTDVAENESIFQKRLVEAAQTGRDNGFSTFYLFTSHTASNTDNRDNMTDRSVLNGMDAWEGREPRNKIV